MNILTTGGGLTASAVALDGSAAALTSAAAALGGKGAITAASGAAGAAASSSGSIWGKALPVLGATAAFAVPAALGAGAYFGAEYLNEQSGITRESTREKHRRQAAKYNWYGKYIGDQGGSFNGPEMSPTMMYGTGVGGDKSVSVSGEVHGQAEIKFVVEAGSSLLQVVEQSRRLSVDLRGALNSNGPGSAGHSSPDAGAASSGQAGAP